jgi:hypothetical protein
MMPTTHYNLALCKRLIGFVLLGLLSGWARASELHVPAVVEAGQAVSISVGGSGQGTFYLIGPEDVVKRTVSLGSDVRIQASDLRSAGRYRAILCDSSSSSSCTAATFEVKAGQPARLSFFLHPSRVPVSFPDSIDATAFVFDRYFNLVLNPTTVDFRIAPAGGEGFSRSSTTRYGAASMRMGSTAHEGPIQVTAVLGNGNGNVEEARVIQQVAADACHLSMKAVTSGNIVTLETDPVRDCSGNALPDGTVVSFTKIDEAGKSTVDTPIRKGVARTQFSVNGSAQISVACGVMLGNEVAVNINGKHI